MAEGSALAATIIGGEDMKRYIILFASIVVSLVILILGVILRGSPYIPFEPLSTPTLATTPPPTPPTTPEPTPRSTPTREPTPTSEHTPEPTPTPEPTRTFPTPIDHTIPEVSLDNLHNTLPWYDETGYRRAPGGYFIATYFNEFDLKSPYSFPTINDLMQENPSRNEIWNTPEELLSLPRRQIQNRDAAKIVGNDIIRLLHGDTDSIVLAFVGHDPYFNIWIFSYLPNPLINPGSSIAHIVDGATSEVLFEMLA